MGQCSGKSAGAEKSRPWENPAPRGGKWNNKKITSHFPLVNSHFPTTSPPLPSAPCGGAPCAMRPTSPVTSQCAMRRRPVRHAAHFPSDFPVRHAAAPRAPCGGAWCAMRQRPVRRRPVRHAVAPRAMRRRPTTPCPAPCGSAPRHAEHALRHHVVPRTIRCGVAPEGSDLLKDPLPSPVLVQCNAPDEMR